MVTLGWIGTIILTCVAVIQVISIIFNDKREERLLFVGSFIMVAPALVYLWWGLL